MKKQAYTYLLYPLAIISLILTLPLLKSRPAYNLDSMLFVKAVFFDKTDGGYDVFIYSTDAESEAEHFFYGSGKDFGAAIKNAKNGSYKNLFFPSAEVLILGGGINTEDFFELSKYAVETNDFPLSAAVFKGKKEFVSASYVKIADAVRARSLSGDVRLWRHTNELLSKNKAPSLLTVRESADGKIYFER